MDPFSRLGEFEVAHLVEFLDPIDIIRLQRVSRSWRSILNSDYISRIGLLHHFPHVAQSRELRDSHFSKEPVPVDAVLLWRRVVYQYHTRRMGQPTRMHQVLLDFTDPLEWDVAEGYVAWISNERDDRILRVKTLGPDEGELREIELLGDWLEYDERDMTVLLRVVTLKIGKGLAILSLEYPPDWNGFVHPPWSGNRAKFIVIDLEGVHPLLWKYTMDPQQTILGEVEWSEDKLYYLRRTPIPSFDGLDTRDRSVVHFVTHDIFTGAIIQEIALENGNDLVAYKCLAYDVMVVDRPLKHFILVRDRGRGPWTDLIATIYTLTGKIVGKFLISPEQSMSQNGDITRNIFVDFARRHDVFNITETFYCDFNEQYVVGDEQYVVNEEHPFPPETITFNSWCIYPQKKVEGFSIEQRQYTSPVTRKEYLTRKENGVEPTPMARFDILFSTLDVSVMCYDVDAMEIGIDVGVYEERGSGNSGKHCLEQVARRRLSDRRLVNHIDDRAPLEKYFEKVLDLGRGPKGDGRCVEDVGKCGIKIARFVPGEGLLVKGSVHNDYWSCVELCDRYLKFHTTWKPDDGGDLLSGILVLDFHPPW